MTLTSFTRLILIDQML